MSLIQVCCGRPDHGGLQRCRVRTAVAVGPRHAVRIRAQTSRLGHVETAALPSTLTNQQLAHSTDPQGQSSTRLLDDAHPGSDIIPQPMRCMVLPPTINWHLEPRCNYGCKFCFATFEDVKQDLAGSLWTPNTAASPNGTAAISSQLPPWSDPQQLLRVPQLLHAAGASKINFVGGEPFLHPHIFELIAAAKEAGLVTSVVTNGSCLDAAKLLKLQGTLDWLAFSVDASNDDLHAAMGRGLRGEVSAAMTAAASKPAADSRPSTATNAPDPANSSCGGTNDILVAGAASAAGGTDGVYKEQQQQRPRGHLARVRQLWGLAQEMGFRLKLNTVVTSVNLSDDMVPLVTELAPERWKVFQVLPMGGQNDGAVDPLLISDAEFEAWCQHHAVVEEVAGVPFVAETNEEMLGSYAMLDALCRFYTNIQGHHTYGPSIFQAPGGVAGAWAAHMAGGGFDAGTFLARGGLYDWGQGDGRLQQDLGRLQAAGQQ